MKFVPHTSGNWPEIIIQGLGMTKQTTIFSVRIEKKEFTWQN